MKVIAFGTEPVWIGVAAAVAIIALSWLPDFVDDEPDRPPPTTFEPGSR